MKTKNKSSSIRLMKKRLNRDRRCSWSWRKIAQIYGVSPSTVGRWSLITH